MLTTSMTTPDGVNHPAAYALVYPLTIQTVSGDPRISMTLHCWHSAEAHANDSTELSGYPWTLDLVGESAQIALVAGMAPLAGLAWTGEPVADALLAESAIIAAMENVVMAARPEFVRA